MTKALVPLVFFISIVLARLLVHGKIVEKDVDLNVDKSNWKDPYDLFNDAPFAADNAPRTSTGQEESLREYEEVFLNFTRLFEVLGFNETPSRIYRFRKAQRRLGRRLVEAHLAPVSSRFRG